MRVRETEVISYRSRRRSVVVGELLFDFASLHVPSFCATLDAFRLDDLLKLVESMYPRELEKEERVGKFVRKLLTFELMPVREQELETEMSQYDPFNPAYTSNYKAHMLEFLRQLVQ